MNKRITVILDEVQKRAHGRATGFVIGNTAGYSNVREEFHEIPLRETPELIYGGIVARDAEVARMATHLVDGLVDYIFVDDEKKVQKTSAHDGDIGKAVRATVRKTALITYKGNDITASSVDAFLADTMPQTDGRIAAVIGMGNLGSKIALMLLERGVEVRAFRRNRERARTIAAGLNELKSKHIQACITPVDDVADACKGAHIVIGAANEKGVITKTAVQQAHPSAILVDAGRGCFSDDVAKDDSFLVYRTDISIMQKYLFSALVRTNAHVKKEFGRRYIPEIDATLVSAGILGKRGEVVVDDLKRPSRVIGIATGDGDLEKQTSSTRKRLQELNTFFKLD